jgi:hypothetical protein
MTGGVGRCQVADLSDSVELLGEKVRLCRRLRALTTELYASPLGEPLIYHRLPHAMMKTDENNNELG